jgi:Ulp1 protease family, C-terminal catalytic domain
MNSEQYVDQVIMNMSDSKIVKANLQCAPGREYEAGSCISLVVLEEMARAYNTVAKQEADKIRLSSNLSLINPQKYKLYLVNEVGNRIGSKCKSQKCWTAQDFVFQMNHAAKLELMKYTFRPDAPQGRFDWLSTFDINDSMSQYEKRHNSFKFYGAVPMDFADIRSSINSANYAKLVQSGITKVGIIFNLDDSTQPGSHWVSLYTDLDKGEILYFDSFAVKPEQRVRTLMRKQAKFIMESKGIPLDKIKIESNKIQHQKNNTECGVYSMNFLIRMARGDDFEKLCNTPISDGEINKCRKVYFDPYTKKQK